MDDGERIPIVIEQQAPGAANEELREDGTLVIDIAAQPDSCAQAENEDEIVVCAQREETPDATVDGETVSANPLTIQLGEHATVAPTARSVGGNMGGSGVEAKVTLRVEF